MGLAVSAERYEETAREVLGKVLASGSSPDAVTVIAENLDGVGFREHMAGWNLGWTAAVDHMRKLGYGGDTDVEAERAAAEELVQRARRTPPAEVTR
jgi:hypothetical protein